MKKKYWWIVGIIAILLILFLIIPLISTVTILKKSQNVSTNASVNAICEENKQFFEEALNQLNYKKCFNINESVSCQMEWPTKDPYYISIGKTNVTIYLDKNFCLYQVYFKNFENCKSLNNTIISGNYEILSEEAVSCPGSYKTYGCGGIYYMVLDSENNCLFYVDTSKAKLLNEKTVTIEEGKLQLTNRLSYETFTEGDILVLTD